MPLPLRFKPLPHPPGFPSMPSADWVPGGLNIWGKTELDFLEYPNQTISETYGELGYDDIWTSTWPSGLFQFINLKVKLGRCPKNQHVVQLLRMVHYPTKRVTHGEHDGTEQGSSWFNAPNSVGVSSSDVMRHIKL